MLRLSLTVLRRFLLLLLLFGNGGSLAATSNQTTDYEVDTETFDIPGHGELTLEVPRIWNYNFTKTDEQTPPLITFYVLDADEKEIFQLNISVFWDDGYSRNVTRLEYIKDMVVEAGNNTLRYSDQSELELQEISGRHGSGYLFDLSDSSAGKEEYRYLTQGAIGVGEMLVVFSLFSNDEEGVLRAAMLRSIQSARHSARRDV